MCVWASVFKDLVQLISGYIRGDLDEAQIWHVDPLEKAHEFASVDADWVHITDFNEISDQEQANQTLIETIIKEIAAAFNRSVLSMAK